VTRLMRSAMLAAAVALEAWMTAADGPIRRFDGKTVSAEEIIPRPDG
jgi:hypothetical protein